MKRTKGHLFWKKQWYSFCSKHTQYNDACNSCKIGGWQNILLLKLSDLIYFTSPMFWRWWVNKK